MESKYVPLSIDLSSSKARFEESDALKSSSGRNLSIAISSEEKIRLTEANDMKVNQIQAFRTLSERKRKGVIASPNKP